MDIDHILPIDKLRSIERRMVKCVPTFRGSEADRIVEVFIRCWLLVLVWFDGQVSKPCQSDVEVLPRDINLTLALLVLLDCCTPCLIE